MLNVSVGASPLIKLRQATSVAEDEGCSCWHSSKPCPTDVCGTTERGVDRPPHGSRYAGAMASALAPPANAPTLVGWGTSIAGVATAAMVARPSRAGRAPLHHGISVVVA